MTPSKRTPPKANQSEASPRGVGRPAVKREEIIDHLHTRIIGGKLRPGDRLPTRRDLQHEFQTSLSTIQQALDQLADEGFVIPRGKAGTFVTSEPPHKARYGIVVPLLPHTHGYPRFWVALVNEASRLQEAGKSVRIYQGVSQKRLAPDYDAMLSDLHRHRLAGLIFVTNPYFLEGDDVLGTAGVPCVAIGETSGMTKNVTAIRLDGRSFAKKAVALLAKKGRRRIGLILPTSHDHVFRQPFLDALDAAGLPTKSYWIQEISPTTPNSARNLAHLLMRLPHDDRPDGLIIGDDNLVEHATAGVVDAGIHVPDELDMVAHCNFPWPTPSVVAVRRLGYDAREVIAQCVRCIDAQRAGDPAAPPPPLPARFEDELLPDPARSAYPLAV